MEGQRAGHGERDALLSELEGIRDVYEQDVTQFIAFARERNLRLVEGLRQYDRWLDEEHGGKRDSPATINRKIAAAKSRVRHAFLRTAQAGSPLRKDRLEGILETVRLRKLDATPFPTVKILRLEEAKLLAGRAKDAAIRLMVTFLVSTGVRVSEMLAIRLTDLVAAKGGLIQIPVAGRGGKARTIYVKKAFLDRISDHCASQSYLFEHHGEPYSRISVTNRIKREAMRILGREVTPQQLRHSWAAIQIRRGKDIAAVAAILGYSSSSPAGRIRPRTDPKREATFWDLEEAKGKDLGRMDDDGGRAS